MELKHNVINRISADYQSFFVNNLDIVVFAPVHKSESLNIRSLPLFGLDT